MSPFTLNNKHILITGASSGIGRQCAISCSRMGASITLVARNNERLKATLSQMTGINHLIIEQDLTEINQIKEVVEKAVKTLGKIDGFLHAAGIEKTLPLKMHTNDVFNFVMGVNLYAGLEFARIVSLKKNVSSTASLVFISSIMGVVGNAGLTAYSASKGAIISACKSMSIELSRKKIRVNSISPGHVSDSEMSLAKESQLSEEAVLKIVDSHPLGLGSCEDVANAVIFLLSDASKWITGTNMIVDGGYCAK